MKYIHRHNIAATLYFIYRRHSVGHSLTIGQRDWGVAAESRVDFSATPGLYLVQRF